MEVFLCDTKIVVCQQSGIETSTAPPAIMCRVILVLVFWQLDSDTVTLRSHVSNPRQDVETNDICTLELH